MFLLLLFVVFELLFVCITLVYYCGVVADMDSIWDIVESLNFNMKYLVVPIVYYVMQWTYLKLVVFLKYMGTSTSRDKI